MRQTTTSKEKGRRGGGTRGPRSTDADTAFKAMIVATILDSNPEKALDILCEYYRVERPRLAVGVVRGRNKGVLAVYTPQRKEILAASRESLFDPFVILHEFYHHLRYFGGAHRGTEKYADRFAEGYLRAYQSVLTNLLNRERGNSEAPQFK